MVDCFSLLLVTLVFGITIFQIAQYSMISSSLSEGPGPGMLSRGQEQIAPEFKVALAGFIRRIFELSSIYEWQDGTLLLVVGLHTRTSFSLQLTDPTDWIISHEFQCRFYDHISFVPAPSRNDYLPGPSSSTYKRVKDPNSRQLARGLENVIRNIRRISSPVRRSRKFSRKYSYIRKSMESSGIVLRQRTTISFSFRITLHRRSFLG